MVHDLNADNLWYCNYVESTVLYYSYCYCKKSLQNFILTMEKITLYLYENITFLNQQILWHSLKLAQTNSGLFFNQE